MNYLFSTEARWFFPHTEASPWTEWFKTGSTVAASIPLMGHETRDDSYLVLPGSDAVGVKVRGADNPKDRGKFEIKALATPSRPFTLDGSITGRLDQWVKWSFASKNEQLSILNHELLSVGRWITLKKSRWCRKFSFDHGGFAEVNWDDRPDHGCNMELTGLTSGSDPGHWTSVAFEAFGPLEKTPDFLFRTMNHFFGAAKTPPGACLTGLGAMHYPSWLAALG